MSEPVRISVPDARAAFLLDLKLQGRDRTARTYGYLLRLPDLPSVAHLSEAVCRELMTERARTMKLSSLQTFRAALRTFCAWCILHHYMLANPADALPTPKVRAPQHRYLTAAQLRAMYDACTSDAERLIIVLCGASGLRAGELVGLRYRDVGETTIRVMGKGSKPRELAPGALALELCRPPEGRQSLGDFILPWRSTENVRTRVRAIARRVGILDTTTHQLRHSFAVLWLQTTGDAFTLQSLLGHSSAAMVGYYVRDAREAAAAKKQEQIDLAGHLFGRAAP